MERQPIRVIMLHVFGRSDARAKRRFEGTRSGAAKSGSPAQPGS